MITPVYNTLDVNVVVNAVRLVGDRTTYEPFDEDKEIKQLITEYTKDLLLQGLSFEEIFKTLILTPNIKYKLALIITSDAQFDEINMLLSKLSVPLGLYHDNSKPSPDTDSIKQTINALTNHFTQTMYITHKRYADTKCISDITTYTTPSLEQIRTELQAQLREYYQHDRYLKWRMKQIFFKSFGDMGCHIGFTCGGRVLVNECKDSKLFDTYKDTLWDANGKTVLELAEYITTHQNCTIRTPRYLFGIPTLEFFRYILVRNRTPIEITRGMTGIAYAYAEYVTHTLRGDRYLELKDIIVDKKSESNSPIMAVYYRLLHNPTIVTTDPVNVTKDRYIKEIENVHLA